MAGSSATILDEVMAWSLVGADNWGVTARMNVSFRRPVPRRTPDPRRGLGRSDRAGGSSRPTATLVDTATGEVLATADAAPMSPRRRGPQAGAARALRLPRSSTALRPDRGRPASRPPPTGGHARDTATQARSRSAPPPSSPSDARRRSASARDLAASSRRTRTRSPPRSPQGFARPRRPGLSRGPAPDRARASARCSAFAGRSIAAVARGFRERHERERTSARCSTSPIACSASPSSRSRWFAFGLLERLDRRRPRADLAAPAPRRPRGRRLDHRRQPRPPGRQGHPARAVPLGGARAARLLAVALGAPPRRQHDRDDPVRRPSPRSRAGRRAARPRPILADLIGDAEPDVQKALSWALRIAGPRRPRGRRRSSSTPRPPSPRAMDDGHRAWVIRDALPKLDPRTRASRLRAQLDGIRRASRRPSTSRAAETAARFGGRPAGRATRRATADMTTIDTTNDRDPTRRSTP